MHIGFCLPYLNCIDPYLLFLLHLLLLQLALQVVAGLVTDEAILAQVSGFLGKTKTALKLIISSIFMRTCSLVHGHLEQLAQGQVNLAKVDKGKYNKGDRTNLQRFKQRELRKPWGKLLRVARYKSTKKAVFF